ncbi:MAG: hypothetical protein JXB38_00305 [Anaerolineales bacterium]|nr:hypothetical protein [Anaerolineales bacterium]
MDKLREISLQRIRAHTKLLELDSNVYKAFLEMEKAAFADGALPKKIKELIAVGIEMGGGPATVSARFALEVMAEVFPDEM